MGFGLRDAKNFGHGATYHGEDPLSLANASWEILTNYKKKKHVCKLRLGDGGEYLFQCKDEEELQRWSQAMEKAIQPSAEEAKGPSGAKAHTLPAALPEPSSAKKDKEKKFSRFAKKK
uniref:PH domain-containing protein n=1 Tax=Mola mola TaxID=94237 RepID=A0A3Q3WR44_MOLML